MNIIYFGSDLFISKSATFFIIRNCQYNYRRVVANDILKQLSQSGNSHHSIAFE